MIEELAPDEARILVLLLRSLLARRLPGALLRAGGFPAA